MTGATSAGALAGRVALVTGSGKNIGRAIVLAFAREGADVVVNGHRDRAAVDEVVSRARDEGVRAIGVMADVADHVAVEAMVHEATERLGKVDIAVSNVAVRRRQPFLELTPADWKQTLNSNLDSAFYVARSVLPGMKQRGWGRIVHISGVDGFVGHLAERVPNVVAKAGLHAMTKGISMEFAAFGITANTVAPGHIDTSRDWSQYGSREEWIASRIAHIPVRRMGSVDEVAAACVYLASAGAGFVTGQVIHVNGGQFML